VILLDPTANVVIAHRGASGEFPENTLLAFRQGLAEGADALELDVRLTGDGVVAVIHDATVDRTTSGSGWVREIPMASLAALDAGRGEAIPTLDQVLESFPEVPLIVEAKEIEVALPLSRVLLRHGAAARTLVGSFLRKALEPFDATGFQRAASRSETGWFWAASRIGLAARCRFGAFTVPARHRGLPVVDRAFTAAAGRRGVPVHVWTVNDRSEAERLRACGAAGIITNLPGDMRNLPPPASRSRRGR